MNELLTRIGRSAIETIDDPLPALFLLCAIAMPGGQLLASEHFRLVRFEGQENASDLFDYQLELHANTDDGRGEALEFEDVIGRPVTVGIARPGIVEGPGPDRATEFVAAVRDGTAPVGLSLFNGIVASFAMEVPGVYRVVMKPAMHRMTLTNDYTVHTGNVHDVIVALLRRHRIEYSMVALTDQHNPALARTQDWLQAGETDFEFLRRLMGKVHLYFYFVHTATAHKVIFANTPAYPRVYPDGRALRYAWTEAEEVGLAQEDVIYQYSYQRELGSTAVQGVFTRQHACWEDDKIARTHSYASAQRGEPGDLPFRQYRIYQYGCSAPEVEHYTLNTDAAMQAATHVLTGSSRCTAMRAGHQFALDGHEGVRPIRPALDGQRFVLTQVQHEADAGGAYRNQFRAAPASTLITGYSIQETQQGSVLAQVVEKTGDAPTQDWRYYTAGYYDPETNVLSDADSVTGDQRLRAMGVYVRFSSAPNAPPRWIKLAPHMQTVPEPGVTVLVSRAQDESELPEIQSIIHSNGTKVIMPSGWTANSHVGGSYSTSYGDGKSIRFGEKSAANLDQAKAKVDGAYKTGRYRETSYAQGASYSYACSEQRAGAATDDAQLFGDYRVPKEELLSASESFGSTYSRHYASVVSSYSDIGTSYNESVTGTSETRSKVTGKSTSHATHKGDVYSMTKHDGADVESHTLVIGDSTSSSVVTGSNVSTSAHLIAENTSVTGVQASMNTVLANTAVDLTGISKRRSLTGAAAEVSVSGSHTSVQVMAQNNSVQMVAQNNVVELLGPGIHISEKATQVKAETRDINVTIIVAMQIYM